MTFGKVRLSYGEVGIEPQNYITQTVFGPFSRGSSWGESLDASVYGNPFGRSSNAGNPNLDPERVKEWEVGADLRFFNDKLSLGATYYNRVTEDALLAVDLPSSTGFSSFWDNAATITNTSM